MINKRKTGFDHETMAIGYLEDKGYDVIARNVLNRFGEIDIICISPDGTLVFTEVKYRKDKSAGDPLEAVGIRKQRRICKASMYFLNGHGKYYGRNIRYDVIGITGDEIVHIENAFEYLE